MKYKVPTYYVPNEEFYYFIHKPKSFFLSPPVYSKLCLSSSGEFSFQKLELIGKNEHGAFILRQCQKFYNVYYLDVCGKKG